MFNKPASSPTSTIIFHNENITTTYLSPPSVLSSLLATGISAVVVSKI